MTTAAAEKIAKHTPGPWVGFNERGKLVAIMPANRPGDVASFSAPYPSDADAALLLAAPNLLEAARDLIAAEELLGEEETSLTPKPRRIASAQRQIDAAHSKLRKAVALAEQS